MSTNLITEYLEKITSQYQNSTKFKATVQLLLQQLQKTYDGYTQIQNAFDIDNAVGLQLDVIGEIVGAPRSINLSTGKVELGDTDYRFFIKAIIARNMFKGDRESFLEVTSLLLNTSTDMILIETSAMNCTLSFNQKLTDIQEEILQEYLARPCGVNFTLTYITTGKIFALADDNGNYSNPNLAGFDIGHFATEI